MKRYLAILLAIFLALFVVSCAEPDAPTFTVSFEGIEEEIKPITIHVGEKFKLPEDLPVETGKRLVIKMGDIVLEKGLEYEIAADTVLKCEWVTQVKLVLNGTENFVDVGYVYKFKEEDKPGCRLEFKLNGEITDERSFTITGNTAIDYRWIEQITINVDGTDTVVDKGKYIIPAKKGVYTESVKIGDNSYKIGDEIEVSAGMQFVYNFKAATEGLAYSYSGVIGYTGTEANVVIPDTTPDGEPLKNIDSKAFQNNKNIKSVLLGHNVETIGEQAFEGCTELKTIHWNENLEYIGSFAFNMGYALEKITLPETLTHISSFAFNAAGITDIVIPESVTTIGVGAFQGCSSLKNVTVNNNKDDCTGFEKDWLGYIDDGQTITVNYKDDSVTYPEKQK